MNYSIRSAEQRDFDAVLELWRHAEAQPTHTDDVEGLDKLFERDGGALLLAEFEGELVGSIIAAWDGWRGPCTGLWSPKGAADVGLGGAS
jgi:hypothetical protein